MQCTSEDQGVHLTSVKWNPCVPHLRRFPAFSPSHQGSMERRKETTRSREMSFKSNGTSFPPERHVKRRPFVMTPHSWSSDSSQISACAASSNQWVIHSKGAGRVSEDFTGGWSGSSSIIAPLLSLLAPRSSILDPQAKIRPLGRYSRWRRQINFRWYRARGARKWKITEGRRTPRLLQQWNIQHAYVVEQRVVISSAWVNHRPYFTYLTKTYFPSLGLIPAPLL